jgi:hypothetical protein
MAILSGSLFVGACGDNITAPSQVTKPVVAHATGKTPQPNGSVVSILD